jgi:RNA chaperone Hfq
MGSRDQGLSGNPKKSNPSSPTIENFDCTTPFLNKVRKMSSRVEVYLFSGIRLIGVIEQFDKTGIIFDGGTQSEVAKKQLIMRTAICSIVPLGGN